MSKQFEELSQPVAWRWRMRTEAVYNFERTASECAGKGPEAMYSQVYVTAILAALEEKDRRIAELEQRLQQPIKLSANARQYIHSYTDGAEADCREYDPDTGIFGNEELADEIENFRAWLVEGE